MKKITNIRLRIAGAEYSGWDTFQVESNFRQPADAFSMGAPNIDAALAGKFAPGNTVQVLFDRTLVFDGVLDDVEYTGTAESERVSLTGRDKFAHLVDNSAPPGTYRNVTLLTLARQLSSAWSLTWTLASGITLTSNKLVKIEPGEMIFDALLRVAKKDGVVLWYSPDGIAHIGRPNYSQLPTHRITYRTSGIGNNALGHRVTETWRDRYATITVDGSGKADATNWGRTTHRRAVETDAEVTGPRSLVLVEEVANIKQARQRAETEVQNRAYDGLVINYTMAGHYGTPYNSANSPVLFDADQIAAVIDEPAGIEGNYWIAKRRWSLDADGEATTEIELHGQGWMA
jgi:prophage tail gpP-like protein